MPGSDWDSDGEENHSSTSAVNFSNSQSDSVYDDRCKNASNAFTSQGFGSERGFGNRRGYRSGRGGGSNQFGRGLNANEDGQMRSGPRRGGFGSRDDGRQRSGFSDRQGTNGNEGQMSNWEPGNNHANGKDVQTTSWIPKQGGNDEDIQNSNWAPRGAFGRREEGQRQRGGFNNENSDFSTRGRRGRGFPSGDFARSGFEGKGGYRASNEEVGIESSEGHELRNANGDQGPKVTYIPPPPPETEEAIFKHYQTGINFDKYDDIIVDVSGVDAPPAIMTFEEANLCDTLNKNISRAGYVKLTPIQKYSIPIIMAGRDLMACAQTGSGKTAAFLLPILAYMMNEGITSSSFKELQEPEAIIVAPTRELINQIYLDARKFAYGTCVRPVVIYGGTQTGHSIRQIFQGCNILCATPGRLMDIIGKEKIGLSKVKFLVLDEADRMLDMGFGPEITKLVTSPNMPSKEERQTLMFSATFPKEIQNLASAHLKPNYLFVVVGQVGGACSDVEQSIMEVTQFQKREKLLEILNNIGNERTMLFVKTKKSADFIASFLCQQNITTTSIHGDREQREREIALFDFRSGKCSVLAATSVAARGLDIENVQHVINFDLPKDIDEYVHRIGRTGRCGNTGKAISFFDPANQEDVAVARSLVKVLTDAHQEVPPFLEEIAYNAHGTSGYNPHGNVFASVDNRKKTVQESIQSTAFVADEEENWG
ncbi:probable ATP-dependent RNA helicase DDX4 isoform X1 [Pelobates fuscus]|uniref:probable ATP-dependent RNA helicase DDX4 isoform X1 n=1 Tax=Pelobates fuscus TaxID=191477 RepID=UPI002FE44D4C